MRVFEIRNRRNHILSKRNPKAVVRKEIPDYVFTNCPKCHVSIPNHDLMQNGYVCCQCGHHFRISARERIRQLCDENSFKEILKRNRTTNIEGFEGYDEKLEKARRSTGMEEAVICGTGKIENQPLVLAVMDSHFMMGSMSMVVGEKITCAVELSQKKQIPLLIVCTSGGARMQEGINALVQMAKTASQIQQSKELVITCLTDPTTGGVSASFAFLGDIILAEPKALIGFAGKRVIEQTIGEKLPDDFQSAEQLLSCGMIDAIVDRRQLRHTLGTLLRMHRRKMG